MKKSFKPSPNSCRIFSVPNNRQGRLFLKLMSQYANVARYDFKKVGRGPKQGPFGGCALKVAAWVEVKAYPKKITYNLDKQPQA